MPLLYDNNSEDQQEFLLKWYAVRERVRTQFGKRPDLNAILFLIGINEVGIFKEEFTKEEKQTALLIQDDRIIPEGAKLLDREGHRKFSMRRLAAAFGVDPMAIYHHIPSYDIRGSISGFDTALVREQADVGFEVDDFGFGGSKSASGSVMSLDLSVISTSDLSVVPGVFSRNSLTLLDDAFAVDADASIIKAGINFSLIFGFIEIS